MNMLVGRMARAWVLGLALVVGGAGVVLVEAQAATTDDLMDLLETPRVGDHRGDAGRQFLRIQSLHLRNLRIDRQHRTRL